jgi:transposase
MNNIFIGDTITLPKGEAYMRITQTAEKIKLQRVMDVSVDVHKDTLNFFFESGGMEYSDTVSNRTEIIRRKLKSYHEIVSEHGSTSLRILCEPTGQYQNKLFRTARSMGFLTNFVNAESVAKFRVIETNDTGKTDTKDPRVIRTLGKLDKVIKHRIMPEGYLILRKLNKIYDEIDVAITSLRCRTDRLLIELFCDYSFKKDFLYTASGFALVNQYGCNPYLIIKDGYKRFCKVMTKAAPRIRKKTLSRLWEDAQSSVLNEQPEGYIKTLQSHLKQLIGDWIEQTERKNKTVEQMIEILNKLREEDPNIPPPTAGVINDKNMARLLGETGPLSDFGNWRMLMRYGGLNIRMKQSGKFQGQNRITKRGRPLLRKVLQHIVLPLVRKKCLYGQYYHRKKEIEKMPGNKAMTCVARHFLKKFYGWYKSGKAFDQTRFFACETQIKKAA